MIHNKLIRFLAALALGFIGFIIVSFIGYEILVAINPPYSIDPETGREQHVMPTGQMLGGFLVGFLSGLIVIVVAYRKLSPKLF